MRYRLALLCCFLLAFAAFAQAADSPKALLLINTVVAPAQEAADRLGVSRQVEGDAVTFTKGDTTLKTTRNRRAATLNGKAIILPAPVFTLNETPYLPLRAVAEAFGAAVTYDAAGKTVTLTRAGVDPLPFPVAPFPRPACVKDDTLAGLTPGDHLALAVMLWGELDDGNEGPLPGYTSSSFVYTGVNVIVYLDVQADRIARIIVDTGGEEDRHLLRPYLKATGTASGIRLWSKLPPADLRRATVLTHSRRDKSFTLGITHGNLLIACYRTYAFGPRPITGMITLVPKNAPKSWYVD
ncbi:MAG: copper amine oxidase N-terminal domain-containing protein [Armatimonadota bacterium]